MSEAEQAEVAAAAAAAAAEKSPSAPAAKSWSFPLKLGTFLYANLFDEKKNMKRKRVEGSDSEGSQEEDDDEGSGEDEQPLRHQQPSAKKKKDDNEYDTDDSFIDDTGITEHAELLDHGFVIFRGSNVDEYFAGSEDDFEKEDNEANNHHQHQHHHHQKHKEKQSNSKKEAEGGAKKDKEKEKDSSNNSKSKDKGKEKEKEKEKEKDKDKEKDREKDREKDKDKSSDQVKRKEPEASKEPEKTPVYDLSLFPKSLLDVVEEITSLVKKGPTAAGLANKLEDLIGKACKEIIALPLGVLPARGAYDHVKKSLPPADNNALENFRTKMIEGLESHCALALKSFEAEAKKEVPETAKTIRMKVEKLEIQESKKKSSGKPDDSATENPEDKAGDKKVTFPWPVPCRTHFLDYLEKKLLQKYLENSEKQVERDESDIKKDIKGKTIKYILESIPKDLRERITIIKPDSVYKDFRKKYRKSTEGPDTPAAATPNSGDPKGSEGKSSQN